VLPAWDRDNPLAGFVLGLYAFGLEETGDLSQAEDFGREALARNRRDAWATHALAHVMETANRHEEGVAFLKSTRDDWAPAHFMAHHNGWHLALFLIEQGRFDEVLADYDRYTAPKLADDATLDRVDAASLLWRLELAGVDVGDRWAPVANAWMAHVDDHLLALQLVMLSAAAQRDDRSLTPPEKLKGGAAHRVAAKLIAAGLVKEVKAKAGTPVWRRNEQAGHSYALKLTAAGVRAIAVDPEDDAEPAGDGPRPGIELDRSPKLAQPGRTAAGVLAAPSPQALASPRPPRAGTKLAEAVEMLRAIEGATITESSAAMGWLPHTTRAVLTGLRKRGYVLTLNRSDEPRGSAYRIAVVANAAHAERAPIVIEPPSSALDGALDPSASPVRPASAAAPRRLGSTRTSRAA
jgi:hypothetical protein